MKFPGKVGNGPVNKWLNLGEDPDDRLDTGIVFRSRHYCEIQKLVNGHSFVLIRQMATDKMCRQCLGGGLHCPSASSWFTAK